MYGHLNGGGRIAKMNGRHIAYPSITVCRLLKRKSAIRERYGSSDGSIGGVDAPRHARNVGRVSLAVEPERELLGRNGDVLVNRVAVRAAGQADSALVHYNEFGRRGDLRAGKVELPRPVVRNVLSQRDAALGSDCGSATTRIVFQDKELAAGGKLL